MRKTIYSIGFLVIESVFSVGLFTSCGDQFQEEYPWLIGKQEEIKTARCRRRTASTTEIRMHRSSRPQCQRLFPNL